MSDKSDLLMKLADDHDIKRKARLKKKQTESILEHVYEMLTGEVVIGNDDEF